MKTTSVSFKLFLSSLLTAVALVTTAIPATAQAQLTCQELFDFEAATQQVLTSDKAQAASDKPAAAVKSNKVADLRESLKENYEKRNAILSDRYKDLAFVFKDPEAFVKTMKDRFEAQKKITPEDPRLFNFPEAAATMKQIQGDLVSFRAEVSADLLKAKQTLRNRISNKVLGKESKKVETLTKVIEYIDKVQKDIGVMTSSGNYPYRDTVYAIYYYSRIRGIFQFKELNFYYQVTKYIDMVMHGYRRLNIDDELQLYEAKGSPIVQVRSGKIAHEFRIAELPFRDAFERTDVLEFIIIPSVYNLGSSAFMHVLPHNIHFLGATNTPIAADGFKRPGGLFWMHDVRHEADRYMKINSYRKAHNLTAKQQETLSLLMQQWHADFLKLKNSFHDENMKGALEHYHFYTHHDVGVPMIPSMFLNHHKDGREVFYAFLYHKKWSGQTPSYTQWFKATNEAAAILTKFWEERLSLEKDLLGKDPVRLKNWEDWFPKSHASESMLSVFNKAIETEAPIRFRTSNSGVDGTLAKVIYSATGEPIYVQFKGPAQLIDRADRVITGQGPESHVDGYSSPVGRIKSITINGRQNSNFGELRPNQKVEVIYESGVVVRGDLKEVVLDESYNPMVLTFSTAEVRLNEKQLYNPAWGKFDLILGDQIQNVEFL